MRKQTVMAWIAGAFLLTVGTAPAQAGGHGYRGQHYNPGHHYSRGYGGHHGGGYYHGGGDNDFVEALAIVTGVAILGSVIYGAHQNQPRRSAPAGPAPANLWYRVDANGQCVEVRPNQQGLEVWTNVDPSYCR